MNDSHTSLCCIFKMANVKFNISFVTKHKCTYTQTTPLEITIQAGEFEVFKSICQTSIPYILGWNTCMDIASAAAISKGISGGGGQMY